MFCVPFGAGQELYSRFDVQCHDVSKLVVFFVVCVSVKEIQPTCFFWTECSLADFTLYTVVYHFLCGENSSSRRRRMGLSFLLHLHCSLMKLSYCIFTLKNLVVASLYLTRPSHSQLCLNLAICALRRRGIQTWTRPSSRLQKRPSASSRKTPKASSCWWRVRTRASPTFHTLPIT